MILGYVFGNSGFEMLIIIKYIKKLGLKGVSYE